MKFQYLHLILNSGAAYIHTNIVHMLDGLLWSILIECTVLSSELGSHNFSSLILKFYSHILFTSPRLEFFVRKVCSYTSTCTKTHHRTKY